VGEALDQDRPIGHLIKTVFDDRQGIEDFLHPDDDAGKNIAPVPGRHLDRGAGIGGIGVVHAREPNATA
jgi:hypothetical protein